jgi:hypothetical protein
MNSNNDSIADALDLTPISHAAAPALADPKTAEDNNDYEYARQNIYRVIETGANALDELAQVAAQSQHPRAYEVLTNLVKTMVEANKDLMHIKKTKVEIQRMSDDPADNNMGGNKVQNNLFVGSTAELQKFISGMKSGGSTS